MAVGEKPPMEGVGPPDAAGDDVLKHGDRDAAGTAVGGAEKTPGTGKGGKQVRKEQGTAREAGQEERKPVAKTVWRGSDVTRALFNKTEENRKVRPHYEDEDTYVEEYACARMPCNVMAPGKQRSPTALERRTLWLWRNGSLHLEQPPFFVKAIHTVRQRARDWDIQRKHKFFRLFLTPHPGFKMRATGTKYHFFMTMLGMNGENQVTDVTALKFLSTVYTIRCSAESQLIEFLFVRPEDRDQWAGKTIKLPGGEVKLQATDAFIEEDTSVGLDAAALSLLCQLRFLGGEKYDASDVLAVVEKVCEGHAIMEFEPEPSTGNRLLDDYAWLVTLATHEAPAALVKIRELHVDLGMRKLQLGLHQPRLAVHPPCKICLDDWHPRQRCPLREATEEAAIKRDEKRAPKILAISLDEPASLPIGAKPQSETEYFKQLDSEYARLEPEAVAALTAEATAAQVAVAATLEASKAEAKRDATEREAQLVLVAKEGESTQPPQAASKSNAGQSGLGKNGAPAHKKNSPQSGFTANTTGTNGGPGTSGSTGKKKHAGSKKLTDTTATEVTDEKTARGGAASVGCGAGEESAASKKEMKSVGGASESLDDTPLNMTAQSINDAVQENVGKESVKFRDATQLTAGAGVSATGRASGNGVAEGRSKKSAELPTGETAGVDSATSTGGKSSEELEEQGKTADGSEPTDADGTGETRSVDGASVVTTTSTVGETSAITEASEVRTKEGGEGTMRSGASAANTIGTEGVGGPAHDVEATPMDVEDEGNGGEVAAAVLHDTTASTATKSGDRRLSETNPRTRAVRKRASKKAKKVAVAARLAADEVVPTHRGAGATRRHSETQPVGTKRVRADTTEENPDREDQTTAHPPTRQARVATVHTCVTAADTLSEYFEAAKSRIGKGKKKQLSLSGFCKPISVLDDNGDPILVAVQEGDEDDDDFDIVRRSVDEITSQSARAGRAAPISPEDAATNRMRFSELKSSLALREIKTPATGSCLAYAVHGARTARHVKSEITIKDREATKEAESYREQIALHGHDNIDEFFDNGTCTEEDFCHHHLSQTPAKENVRAAIKEFFLTDGAQPVDKMISRRHWGSATHLKLISNYTKEPVFCVDMLHRYKEYRDHEIFVQKYVPSLTANAVRVELPTVAETIRQWNVYASQRVLPLILVLHHFFDENGGITGHYTALRPDQKYYKAWSGTTTKQRAMLERLQVATAIIEGRQPPQGLVHQFPTPTPSVGSPDVSSVYAPSTVSSNAGDTTEAYGVVEATKEDAAQAEVLQASNSVVEQGAVGATEKNQPLPHSRSSSPSKPLQPGLSLELSLALDSTPSSVFSSGMALRSSDLPSLSTGSPATALLPPDECELLQVLETRAQPDADTPAARLLQQAKRANRSFFNQWRKAQQHAGSAVADWIKDCVTLEEACEELRDTPIYLVQLLRALPHAHVLLATTTDQEIRRLGQALVGVGRMQMLHRFVQSDRLRTEAGKTFCQEWMLAIASAGLGAAQLADDKDRWDRLRNMCRFKLQDQRPTTMEADDWYRLVAFAVVLREHLPAEYQEVAIPQVCDALMTYLAAAGRSSDVNTVAQGLKARQWCSIDALFPADYPQYVLPPATSKQRRIGAQSPPAEAPGSPTGGPDRS